MALDDIARGALRLIQWGKDLAPSMSEARVLSGSSPRLEALFRMVPELSTDAKLIAADARTSGINSLGLGSIKDDAMLRGWSRKAPVQDAMDDARRVAFRNSLGLSSGRAWDFSNAVEEAALAEAAQHLFTDLDTDIYTPLTSALAAGRRFERTVDTAPEAFTSIARSLGELGQIGSAKGVEAARRLSMEDPTFTQLVMSFVQDGMPLEDAMAAARALGLG